MTFLGYDARGRKNDPVLVVGYFAQGVIFGGNWVKLHLSLGSFRTGRNSHLVVRKSSDGVELLSVTN